VGICSFYVILFSFFPGGANGGEVYLIAGLIFASISAFIAWLWFRTYYEIGEEYLKIVSGPIRSKVQICSITSIKRTRNPLSSPALSTERLEIKYGKWNFVLISPQNEVEFCEILKKKNPNIGVDL
jgi:hypothetical protein